MRGKNFWFWTYFNVSDMTCIPQKQKKIDNLNCIKQKIFSKCVEKIQCMNKNEVPLILNLPEEHIKHVYTLFM